MLDFLLKSLFLGCVFFIFSAVGFSQNAPVPMPTVEAVEEDVLEIQTNLIQTGVMVFDKNGRRVDNLKQEDFELQVDGKPVSLSFFEKIESGKNAVETSASEPNSANNKNPENPSAPVNNRGRNIIFVVDDIHLSVETTIRTRRLVEKFIDQDMLPDDTVAIVSTSGRIGFLQQFTSNKTVLKAAAAKILYGRNYSASDKFPPPMTEYEALLVSRRDPGITDLFVQLDQTKMDIEIKKESIRTRARMILLNANAASNITYDVLDSAIRSSSMLPGRKIVFFVSDGFITDPGNSNYLERMRRITDAASRSNTVIYSFDSKGLEAGFPEEGSTANSAQLGFRVQAGERQEFQTPLGELADSTGGKFVRNTNDMQSELEKSLEEASTYYLLAWQPDEENDAKSVRSKKIKVLVKSRPELKIRFQNSYSAGNVAEKSKERETKNKKEKDSKPAISPADAQLNKAIGKQVSLKDLPTLLTANYLQLPEGKNLLLASLQVDEEYVGFTNTENASVAELDVLGILYNLNGKQEDIFKKVITINRKLSKADNKNSSIYYNYQTDVKLKPGLYQLRIATRDARSGRLGSVNQWIEVPDPASKKLSLSNILLGQVAANPSPNKNQNTILDAMQVSVDGQFDRAATLRYLIFAYNPAGKNAAPEIAIQTKVIKNGKVVLGSPLRKLSTEGQDPGCLAYAAEIPLNSLTSGKYVLEVSVEDQASKEKFSRTIDFNVR